MASSRLGTGPWSREGREPRPALPGGEALVRPEASRLAGLLTRYVARRGYAVRAQVSAAVQDTRGDVGITATHHAVSRCKGLK